MPTARELLDQADALMRRNRSPVRDEIPVLTEAVPPETAAQMTQSGHLTDGLGEARRRFEAPLTVRDEWDVVPVLTDVVSAEIHVPLASIDAVEEIDVPSVFDPSEPGGEPSAWLDFDDDGARSVIDAAADSIVVVPDIEAPGPGREETGVERDFDGELQSAGRDEGAYIEPQPAQSEDGAVCAAGIAAQPEEAVFFEKAAESDEAIAVTDLSMRHDATGEEPTGFYDGGINELTIPEHDAVDEPTSLYAEAGVREETAAQADELVVIHAFAPQPDEPVVIHEFAAQPDASVVIEEFA
nr:hypothetical protein [Betaproteobacteria bacterium]